MDAVPSIVTKDDFASDVGCAIWSDVNVLISGSGLAQRRALARLIHRRSARRQRPFVIVQANAVADLVSPSSRPGFFHPAADGTLFIEEVSRLHDDVQSDLLEMLWDGGAPGRRASDGRRIGIIAATSLDLVDHVAGCTFRGDLFYRLNAIHLVLDGRRKPPKVWLM